MSTLSLLFSFLQRIREARTQQQAPQTTTITSTTTNQDGSTTVTTEEKPYSVLETLSNNRTNVFSQAITARENLKSQEIDAKVKTAPMKTVVIIIGLIITIIVVFLVIKFMGQSGQQFMQMKTGGKLG